MLITLTKYEYINHTVLCINIENQTINLTGKGIDVLNHTDEGIITNITLGISAYNYNDVVDKNSSSSSSSFSCSNSSSNTNA